MKRFRIGNDITIIWEVKKSGVAFNLSGMDVKLYMTHARGREELNLLPANLDANTITYVLEGMAQEVLGRYTLTVDVRNAEGKRVLIQDKCGAFELVGRSCVEEPEETDYIVEL